MEIFTVIFKNFFGFDMIIFIAAICNGALYYYLRKMTDKLRGMMNHNIFVPHFHLSRMQTNEQVARLSEEEVLALHGKTGRLYSLFINITGIFPLLGILGTVVSLLGLVSDMDNVTGNFYGALTSTFWGLIFAILFKFIDGMISPDIENNDRSVRIFLEQNSNEDIKAAKPAPEPEPVPEPEEVTVTEIITDEPAPEPIPVLIEANSDEE